MGPSERRATADGRPHRPVHFVAAVVPGAVAVWEPDRAPERYADGEGHQVVELYARLRDLGLPVTIGPHPPRGALLVMSADHLVSWFGHPRRREQAHTARLALTGHRLVVVLGDHPHPGRLPAFAGTRVAPTPTAARQDPRAVWIPLLPQRALVPRNPDRQGTVRTLAMKAHTDNVPPEYRDPDFARRLAALGVEFRIDDAVTAWPDFSTIDAVLCVARPQPRWDAGPSLPRKPPTKLVNAWAAGCLPLIAPQTGYLDLARPDVDAVVVESPAAVLAQVERLLGDPAAVTRIEAGVAARSTEFARDAVTDRWIDFLWAPDRGRCDRAAAARCLLGATTDALRHRLRRPPG